MSLKTYPGYARVRLAENGTIELVQFRKLGAPAGQRAASPGFAELQLLGGLEASRESSVVSEHVVGCPSRHN